MTTSTTSNWRPLLRALSAFLITTAVLWAMPRNAQAQLYVTQLPDFPSFVGIVSEYNATTGAVINASFITGLNGPDGLALLGNTLFVANGTGNTVGTYDATTGGAINPGFITGLNVPTALAIEVSTLFTKTTLFVANVGNNTDNTVGKYNAATGEVINASFITGLKHLGGLAIRGRTTSFGNALNVSNLGKNTVGKYSASGKEINADFITGLKHPQGLAIKGNTLFVANAVGNTVGTYSEVTGDVINAHFIKGLDGPVALAFSGDTLFVLNQGSGTVGTYDATTGAAINPSFITGLTFTVAIAVK